MTTKLIQHELMRISSMTDKQLVSRYEKMTKSDKIHAFHEALVQTSRALASLPLFHAGVGATIRFKPGSVVIFEEAVYVTLFDFSQPIQVSPGDAR